MNANGYKFLVFTIGEYSPVVKNYGGILVKPNVSVQISDWSCNYLQHTDNSKINPDPDLSRHSSD